MYPLCYSFWAESRRPNGTILVHALKSPLNWKISFPFQMRSGLRLGPCCSKDRKLLPSKAHSGELQFKRVRDFEAKLKLSRFTFLRAASTRTAATIWWFFTLIMVSSYTANLAAFLTFKKPHIILRSAEDLKDCADPNLKCPVRFGAKKVGATINFFKVSVDRDSLFGFNEYSAYDFHSQRRKDYTKTCTRTCRTIRMS